MDDSRSDAGLLFCRLRADLHRHLEWYAEKGPDGLLFVAEEGKPFHLRAKVARGSFESRSSGSLPLRRPSSHRAHVHDPFRRDAEGHDGAGPVS